MKKVLVAIDLANINGALRLLQKNGEKIQIDFNKLVGLVTLGSQVFDQKIYAECLDDEKSSGFFYFLEKNGFKVISKKAKKLYNNENGETRNKANFDVEIATDISDATWKRECDEVILFSGDSDFAYLVDKVKERGISVTIVSSERTISRELRERANRTILLDEIIEKIRR